MLSNITLFYHKKRIKRFFFAIFDLKKQPSQKNKFNYELLIKYKPIIVLKSKYDIIPKNINFYQESNRRMLD